MEDNLELIQKFVEENRSFIEENPADKIPEVFKDKYREYVDILCENNIEIGLYEKAYGSYTGNAVYKQDWEVAEKYLLKILGICEDPYVANSLGYIYYYGRTNKGKPDYDKALKYFIIAEMHGITEARYKLCDMLMYGKGFPVKMPKMVLKDLYAMYYDLIEELEAGNYSSEFADIAVRLGNYNLEMAEVNTVKARLSYDYYMIAKYALELRIKHDYKFGDNSIMEKLLPRYEEAKALFHKNCLKEDDGTGFFDIIKDFVDNTLVRVQIRKLRNGKHKISLIIDPAERQMESYQKILVSIPEIDFCKLVGRIDLVYNGAPEIISSKRSNFIVDAVEIEKDELNFCIYESVDDDEGMYEKVIMRLKKDRLGILKIE